MNTQSKKKVLAMFVAWMMLFVASAMVQVYAHDKELAADGCHWETISPSHRERHCHDDNSWKTIGISAAVLAALWVISEAMDDSKFVDQLLPPHREDAIDWDFNASADGMQLEFHIPVDF